MSPKPRIQLSRACADSVETLRDIRKREVSQPADRLVPEAYGQRGKLLVALLAAVFLACAPGIRAPEVRVQSVSAKSAQETIVGLAIYNPNPFPLHVQSVDYEVSVGKNLCGRGRREELLFLDARETTDAEFNLSLDWSGVMEALPSLLTDSVTFSVKGSYVASTVFGRRRFGFDGRRTVSVKDEARSFIENLFGE
jgi:LEA14-like dessication related protein